MGIRLPMRPVGTANWKRYHSLTMRLKGILFAVIAVSLIASFAVMRLAPDEPVRVPDLTVTTLQGEPFRIPRLQGKPLLVNFWATSCRNCLEEIPRLIELHRELNPNGFEIIGIAMPYDPPNRVIAVSQAKQIPYPIALDIRGEAARAFGNIRLTPSSFLIAPDGRVIHRQTGELQLGKLRALLADMRAQNGDSRTTLHLWRNDT
jgi:thiol-disulfide isomerase/thioredoxin